VRTLVVDPDRVYAATLGQVLNSQGCNAHVASTRSEAVALLQGKRFDVMLIDTQWLSSPGRVILQELYSELSRHLDSPRIYLMSNASASSLFSQVLKAGALESIPATAESILSIVRTTDDSNVVLVAGDAASAELERTLLQEGYPAVVVHTLDSAIRHVFDGTYPVVFLATGPTTLAGDNEFLILRQVSAEPLACLASTQNDSYLRHVVKPQTIVEITELLADLQKELGDAELRMSAGRA
jgi:DNA-binding response OmpR family regulator